MNQEIPLAELHPSDYNPRTEFPEEHIANLTVSIRQHGILNDLIARPRQAEQGGGYEIIAGESRWMAAERAGLATAPCKVIDIDDAEAVQIALIDNIKRSQLTPLDEARGFRLVMERLGWSARKTCDHLGVTRAHFQRTLRLLELPGEVLDQIRGGALKISYAYELARLAEHGRELAEITAGIADGSYTSHEQLAAAVDNKLDLARCTQIIAELNSDLASDPDEPFVEHPDPATMVRGTDPAMPWRRDSPTWTHFLEHLDYEHEVDHYVTGAATRSASGKWEPGEEYWYDRAAAEAVRNHETSDDTNPAPPDGGDSTEEPAPTADTTAAAEQEAARDTAATQAAEIISAATLIDNDEIHQHGIDFGSLNYYLLTAILSAFDGDGRIAEALLACRDIQCDPVLSTEEIHETFDRWALRATAGELYAALIDLTIRSPFDPEEYDPTRFKAAIPVTNPTVYDII